MRYRLLSSGWLRVADLFLGAMTFAEGFATARASATRGSAGSRINASEPALLEPPSPPSSIVAARRDQDADRPVAAGD